MRYLFNNKRYLTRGISNHVSLEIQIFIWNCVDDVITIYDEVDYLHVFSFQKLKNIFIIKHSFEVPNYQRLHYLKYKQEYDNLLNQKIYIIFDSTYTTMLFAHEY